jgi:hypothetical protein
VLSSRSSERTADTEWRRTSSALVARLTSEYEPVISECQTRVRSVAALRQHCAQYGEWISAYRSKPSKDTVKRLAMLKVELEHAEGAEERVHITAQISALEAEPREYRLRWRTARDRLIDCLGSGYFAELETDDTLKYMLLPERYVPFVSQSERCTV